MLFNLQVNDEQIKLEKSQMNPEEHNTLNFLWVGEETDANYEQVFPPASEDYVLNAAKNKNDEDDEKEDDDDYYNEEEDKDENPFDKEPTDKDIVEGDVPLVDPEEDLLDDDEEVPYN